MTTETHSQVTLVYVPPYGDPPSYIDLQIPKPTISENQIKASLLATRTTAKLFILNGIELPLYNYILIFLYFGYPHIVTLICSFIPQFWYIYGRVKL
ncbi:hypothetical protein HDV00_005292 [Rhizophlyctis rosea]|nr:hypothetical protein HDV00_005292 [Rhizophlyctis rosea]